MEVAMMSNNIRESATANNPTVLVPTSSPCSSALIGNNRKECSLNLFILLLFFFFFLPIIVDATSYLSAEDLVRMNITDRCSVVPDHLVDHLECPSPEALLRFPTTTTSSTSRNISSLRLIGCSATPEKEDAQLGSLLDLLTNVSTFRALRELSVLRCDARAARFEQLPQLELLDLSKSRVPYLRWTSIGSAYLRELRVAPATLNCTDCRNAWLLRNITAAEHSVFPRLPQRIHLTHDKDNNASHNCTQQLAKCLAESAVLDRQTLAGARMGSPLRVQCRFRKRNAPISGPRDLRVFTWPFSTDEDAASVNASEQLAQDGTQAVLHIDALRARHLGIVACRCWHCDAPVFDTAEIHFPTPLSVRVTKSGNVADASNAHTLIVHGYPQDALRLSVTQLQDNSTEEHEFPAEGQSITRVLFNGSLLVRPEPGHSQFFVRYFSLALHECSDCTHAQAGGAFLIRVCRTAASQQADLQMSQCADPVLYELDAPKHPVSTSQQWPSASAFALRPHVVLLVLLALGALAGAITLGTRALLRIHQRMQLREKLRRRSRRASRNTQRTEETSIPLDTLSRTLSLSANYILAANNCNVPVVDARELQLQQRIGKGAFGEVYAALWNQPNSAEAADDEAACMLMSNGGGMHAEEERTPATGVHADAQPTAAERATRRVAVKLLVGVQMDAELEREAGMLSRLQHAHVLRMFGLTQCGAQIGLVLELMSMGDLRNYLRARAPRCDNYAQFPPALLAQELLNICVQMADGLCYLVQQQIVHRDLAARNCLVSGESDAHCCNAAFRPSATVKIADFGMSRRLYAAGDYYRMHQQQRKGNKHNANQNSGALLPVRWMPPECMGPGGGKFTHQSDMWSFGVLLFEVFSYGQMPFGALSNEEVLSAILGGMRPEVPERCRPELADLMRHCWHRNPAKRVQAEDALTRLRTMDQSGHTVP